MKSFIKTAILASSILLAQGAFSYSDNGFTRHIITGTVINPAIVINLDPGDQVKAFSCEIESHDATFTQDGGWWPWHRAYVPYGNFDFPSNHYIVNEEHRIKIDVGSGSVIRCHYIRK